MIVLGPALDHLDSVPPCHSFSRKLKMLCTLGYYNGALKNTHYLSNKI